jgi:hypothetical protein
MQSLDAASSNAHGLSSIASATEGLSIKNQKSKIKNVMGWFDVESLPIMQKARRTRLAAVKAGFDMGIPFNELNRAFDLGFTALPWGDTGYLPTSVQPISTDPKNLPRSTNPPHIMKPFVHD